MQEAKHRLAAVRGYLLPVVIAVLAHGLGLGGEFVADDIPDILQHPVVTGAAPIGEVLDYNYMGAPLGEGANTLSCPESRSANDTANIVGSSVMCLSDRAERIL